MSIDPITRLREDFRKFIETGLPRNLESLVRDGYALDLSSHYGTLPVKNPFGKASGQLSLNTNQIARDADAGLGFCVLKTVVAQDTNGRQSMGAWAIPAAHMVVEKIKGTRVDEEGWTVTWKGRGWSGTFEEYLQFFQDSVHIGRGKTMLVVPSCTFHVPADPHGIWNTGEYDFTVNAMLNAWDDSGGDGPMPLEKDFSPTLAGSDVAAQKESILRWLDEVPGIVRTSAGNRPLRLGIKIFNALFDEEFQVEMMRHVDSRNQGGEHQSDYVVYANRLFDPMREFEGIHGVAVGGPDLSARNLATLDLFHAEAPRTDHIPISATGNIDSGRRAAEYLLRGCSTFQLHTFFQLPDDQYSSKVGTKVERAMTEIVFHPEHGFIRSVLELREKYAWPVEWSVGKIAEEILNAGH